jgi:hypothetical protein
MTFYDSTAVFKMPERFEYYRYDVRTGQQVIYYTQEGLGGYRDPRYFTKSGEPRKSIKINSCRAFLTSTRPKYSSRSIPIQLLI